MESESNEGDNLTERGFMEEGKILPREISKDLQR